MAHGMEQPLAGMRAVGERRLGMKGRRKGRLCWCGLVRYLVVGCSMQVEWTAGTHKR